MTEEPEELAEDGAPAPEDEGIEGSGYVTSVKYRSERFSVCCVIMDDSREYTLAGEMPFVEPGIRIYFSAEPPENERDAYRVTSYAREAKLTEAGVLRYLIAKVDGIGEKNATAIWEAWGEDAWQTLLDRPEALRELLGFNARKVAAVRRCMRRTAAELEKLQLELRITENAARRILRDLGDGCLEAIKGDIYRLLPRVAGFGFLRTDDIAVKVLGIAVTDQNRILAGCQHVLDTETEEGNCFVYHRDLVRKAAELLGVTMEQTAHAAHALAQCANVVYDVSDMHSTRGARLYRRWMYDLENRVADKVVARFRETAGQAVPVNFRELEAATGVAYTEEQRRAISGAFMGNVGVLTGAAGCGKTTVVAAIAEALERAGVSYGIVSPTGRGAKNVTERIGKPASTIHRFFRYHPVDGWRVNAENPAEVSYLIVDEASMMSLDLLDRVLDGVPHDCRLLFVGDPNQLPSIQSGNTLSDLIAGYHAHTVKLTQVHRQAAGSPVIRAAHHVLSQRATTGAQGEAAVVSSADSIRGIRHPAYSIGGHETRQEMAAAAVARAIELWRADPERFMNDTLVITPYRKAGGAICANHLNREIRDVVNPRVDGRSIEFGTAEFRLGDKVMVVRNDYDLEVFNGDMGRVAAFDPVAETVTVTFTNRGEVRDVTFDRKRADRLVLAYAMTVHKSQGTEADTVVLLVPNDRPSMLNQNMLYTGITRSRRELHLFTQGRALENALRSPAHKMRNSRLFVRLKRAGNEQPVPDAMRRI